MQIDATGIAVRFAAKPAAKPLLAAVDFAVRAGEMVGLIGPNGAGKSTLLRIIANLRAPDGGFVRYDGRGAADIGSRELARRIAYLAQNAIVHWPMRVDALVALGRLPHRRAFGQESSADRAAIERALVAADVGALRGRTLGQVSAGERMRILLARALAVEAEILLADEPIAALDPRHQLQVMQLLRATARANHGVVVVLHDLSLAARFCDRLVLLAHGGVLAQGAPPQVLTDDLLARAYGVEMLRGERDGVPFLVPWRETARRQ